jgi:hypothetical protein
MSSSFINSQLVAASSRYFLFDYSFHYFHYFFSKNHFVLPYAHYLCDFLLFFINLFATLYFMLIIHLPCYFMIVSFAIKYFPFFMYY